jgi:hypothetical protein
MNKSQDIFGIKHIPVIDYQISDNQLVSGNSSFTLSTVNPSNPNAILGVVFSCTLPEIKGVGRMKYSDYLGYQLINNVVVSFHSTGESAKISGSSIFDAVSNMPNRDELFYNAGHNDILRREVSSQIDNECLKPQYRISVWIPLPFGHNFPHNVLKQPPRTELTININLRNITDIIDCNSNFKKGVLNSSVTNNSLDVLGLYVSQSVSITPIFDLSYESKYISLANSVIVQDDQYKNMTNEINIESQLSTTKLKWRPIVDFSQLKYLCLYGNWHNEDEAINNFMKTYIDEAIIISDKPLDDIKSDYPSGAEIEEVSNYSTSISTVKDSKVFTKRITIIVDKLPLKSKVYFHKNLLKYENNLDNINISEKINIIKGFYHEGKLHVEYLDHSCTSNHACLPLQVYNVNNRKKGSETMAIKKYYLSGFNFINETIEDFQSVLLYDDFEKNNRKFATVHPTLNLDSKRFHCYEHNFEIKYYKLENRYLPDSANVKILFRLVEFISDKLERKYAEVNRTFNYLNHYDSGFLSLLKDFVSVELIRYSIVKIDTVEGSDGSLSLKMLPHKTSSL